MLRRSLLPGLIGLAWLAGSPSIAVGADTPRAGYVVEHERIDAEYSVAKERCDRYAGNAKDVCLAEARAARRIAKAEAEARYKATPKAWYDARVARAEAEFAIARERCGERAGNAKDVCLAEARAAEARAKAEAKLVRQQAEARGEARPHAPPDRCAAMAGDAKERCLARSASNGGRS
jgi:hypothetical protein